MCRLGLVFLIAAGSAAAGEFAVLTNGQRLPMERHEANGAKVRLYHEGGYVEMDASMIKAFEVDESTPPAPAPPTPEPAPQPVSPPASLDGLLDPISMADAAADKYGLPRSLVRSVMATESANQPWVVSPKGAIGLMQLMPETAAELGANPYDPAQNVDAGVRYLRSLLEKYNGVLWHALAAYNAGPGAVDRYNGVPPYRETIQYIRSIKRRMQAEQQIVAGSITPAPAM